MRMAWGHVGRLAGASLQSIDGFMKDVKNEIARGKAMCKEAIPEQYPLLRTVQLATIGYLRALA
jgi:hypothetical protein